MTSSADILLQLYDVIVDRKGASPESSYTASLLHKGIDKILKKIGEEGAEVIIAAKGGSRDEIVYESADLLYHLLVLLAAQDIPADAVFEELRRRFGTSGIAEKASRPR